MQYGTYIVARQRNELVLILEGGQESSAEIKLTIDDACSLIQNLSAGVQSIYRNELLPLVNEFGQPCQPST